MPVKREYLADERTATPGGPSRENGFQTSQMLACTTSKHVVTWKVVRPVDLLVVAGPAEEAFRLRQMLTAKFERGGGI